MITGRLSGRRFCRTSWALLLGTTTISPGKVALKCDSNECRGGNYSSKLHLRRHSLHNHRCFQQFSTAFQFERFSPAGYSSHTVLLGKLETALNHHQVAEAWEAFTDFRSLHGFPNNSLISRLIIQLCYSADADWLRKAYELVLSIVKHKSNLLHYDFMVKLALSLARAQMPIPASSVLRLMLQLQKFPPMDLWRTLFLHMVKTETGTCLASNLLVEICDCYLRHVEDYGAKNVKHLKLLKPDTVIVNLVLDACVRFRSTLKAQQIVELMPLLGIVADAGTIVVVAHIYEMNGQMDEMKKLREHVDLVSSDRLLHHYQQFYSSLLSVYFKYDDIESAAELILDMHRRKRSGSLTQLNKDPQKARCVTMGSCNLRTGLRLCIEPDFLEKDIVLSVENQPELVAFIDGKLVPTNKALAKLINGYNKHENIGELSKFLVKLQRELDNSGDAHLSSDVMDACIRLGWLETAHDILEDMEIAGIPMCFNAYYSLIRAYCKGNKLEDAKVVLKQMKKAGFLAHLSIEEIISQCLSEKGGIGSPNSVRKLGLAESLIQEMREEEEATPPEVYAINSSIYFFCKGNMMEDASRSYRRMQERRIQPTVQTFAYLVNGYASLKMYREITILWGDIKRRMDDRTLVPNWDLHELLVLNFIRGGYFERVMEVVECMKRHGMHADKWKYRGKFLKLHKNLYRSLRASEAKTEAQSKRLEHVRWFRKWVGID